MQTARAAARHIDATPTATSTLRDVKPLPGGAGLRAELRVAVAPYGDGWPAKLRLRLTVGQVAVFDSEDSEDARRQAGALLEALQLDEADLAQLRRALEGI